jgi:hypothetical protein
MPFGIQSSAAFLRASSPSCQLACDGVGGAGRATERTPRARRVRAAFAVVGWARSVPHARAPRFYAQRSVA